MISRGTLRAAFVSAISVAGALACAGPEVPAGTPAVAVPALQPAPGAGSASGATAEVGIPYNEYFNYSSFARRSYAPAYTPHLTSLFENPREYPNALCVIATPYYQYAGMHGWFFGSPNGYQSSVPPNSHALAYNQGELGITANTRYGYPQGLRVIEPVIIPFSSYAERGGVLITGGGLGTAEVGAVQQNAVAPPKATPLPGPSAGAGMGVGMGATTEK
jgi:hypothetical protein